MSEWLSMKIWNTSFLLFRSFLVFKHQICNTGSGNTSIFTICKLHLIIWMRQDYQGTALYSRWILPRRYKKNLESCLKCCTSHKNFPAHWPKILESFLISFQVDDHTRILSLCSSIYLYLLLLLLELLIIYSSWVISLEFMSKVWGCMLARSVLSVVIRFKCTMYVVETCHLYPK